MKLETGRASMIPIMSPLDTIPTTRPRVASGARCAASGTRICTATEPEADRAGANEKHRGGRRERRSGERNRAQGHRGENQLPVLDQIAERDNEHEAGAVADLRHRHDEPGGLRRKAKRLRDRPDQRLGIIDVGDDEAAGRGEQEDRAGRNLRRRRRQSRRFHMIQ